MAEILSQNEIDALIGNIDNADGSETPTAKHSDVPENELSDAENELLKNMTSTIFESCSSNSNVSGSVVEVYILSIIIVLN